MDEGYYFNIYNSRLNTGEKHISAFYVHPGIDVGFGFLGNNLDAAVNNILEKLEGVPPIRITLKSKPPADALISGSTPITSDELTLIIRELSKRRQDITFVKDLFR